MLLIDKYAIKNRNDVVFNKNVYDKIFGVDEQSIRHLKPGVQANKIEEMKINKYRKMSNLLIHGYGKASFINILLNEFYGENSCKTKTVFYEIENYGTKTKTLGIEQSLYHIVIEPNNTGLDKYIIQEVIKNFSCVEMFQTNTTRVPFKIVLIKNADKMSLYAQTSLRRTMETCYRTCRFILCTDQSSKIIEPLRSRCSLIRLPNPSEFDLITYACIICKNENIEIDYRRAKHIVSCSGRDVNMCLWWIQHYVYKITNFKVEWKTYLFELVQNLNYIYKNKIVLKKSFSMRVRKIINDLFLTKLSYSTIINEFLHQLITLTDIANNIKLQIINLFYEYDKRISLGSRFIIHIEALIVHIQKILFENSNKKLK